MTLVMTGGIGAFSMPAFAATLPSTDAPPSTTVNGTTWVQVSNAPQLEYIDQNQNQYLGSNIELMGNLDLTGYVGWVPIGGNSFSPFSGIFNGQGYLISGLTIDGGSQVNVGFFGETSGTIEDVGVDAVVNGGNSHGVSLSGGLVGSQIGGNITDSYTTGSVTGGAVSGRKAFSLTGGLVGHQAAGGSITDSYATGTVTRGEVAGVDESLSGGLVGWQDGGGSITASFFNQDTTNQTSGVGSGSSSGVTGETTQAMRTEAIFTAAGWDFTHTWGIGENVNNGYPYLLDSALNPASTAGQMPEVPFAGALPGLGIVGLAAWAYARRRKG